ncbi:hypothetical protein [Streptosporangium vulgare]|uniref:hypothetical protein n=1 Tax=Streptosporangium vulgare TaxID=46190 RepID=UPI0031CDCF87
MSAVPSVRAVLLDDDRLVPVPAHGPRQGALLVPFPAATSSPEDASLEHTLHREVMEELGAVVSGVTPLTTLECLPRRGRQDPARLRLPPGLHGPRAALRPGVRRPRPWRRTRWCGSRSTRPRSPPSTSSPRSSAPYLADTVTRLPALIA